MYTRKEIRLGNRRLLKLAEFLETLGRGKYDQNLMGDGFTDKGPMCAKGHFFYHTPAGKRIYNDPNADAGVYFALRPPMFQDHSTEILRASDERRLFSGEGCEQKDGRPARTGKQAAKFIRSLVKERDEELTHG